MKKMVILALMLSLVLLFTHTEVDAAPQTEYGIPYQTYTLDSQRRFIPTQTAYIPVGTFGKTLGLLNPEDMYIYENQFYITDSGNKRVVITDIAGNYVDEVDLDVFMLPTGLFVKDDFLYVADKTAKKVFKIDLLTKTVVQTIEKPTSPIYGQQNDFIPIKVAVDSSDSIYIVGEGSTSGIIQVNYAGEFVGYLGINTVTLSLRRILYNFFVKDSDLASSLPASPTNVALGQKGSILTTNVNVNETFKRLNISGKNTLLPTTLYPSSNLSDIYMNDENFVYLVAENGDVFEYDANGNMLFFFNTKDLALTQALGLSSIPKGVVTDGQGNIYILDKGYNAVHVYQRTVFVDLVHEAVTLYNDGRYLESKPIWEEIIRQNSSFALAHSALGAALLKEGKYDEALEEYYDARDYQGYSISYWEIRNIQIQENLVTWVLVIVGALIVLKISLAVFKKSPLYEGYIEKKNKLFDKKLVKELTLSLKTFKEPFDMFFDIKRYDRASYASGSIVLGLFIIVYLVNRFATGFLFRAQYLNSVFIELTVVVGIFLLYVVVNYLVSTLNDGEGRFKDVFIASTYILVPYILLTLPMTFLSHFLTYNEAFIYDFYNQIVVGWTFLLLIMSIKGVHNYTFFELVKNTLIIIFGMFILVLIGLLIYSFLGQLIEFVLSIIREVIYRV